MLVKEAIEGSVIVEIWIVLIKAIMIPVGVNCFSQNSLTSE